MTTTDIQATLDEWMLVTQEADRQLDALMELVRSDYEAPFFAGLANLQEHLCKLVARITGADAQMLSDWWLTHRFGEDPMIVVHTWGEADQLSNNAQMAAFIAEIWPPQASPEPAAPNGASYTSAMRTVKNLKHCSYPECRCPYQPAQQFQCLRGLPERNDENPAAL